MEDTGEGSTKNKLEGKALEDALRKQIEYYFSKENLATDTYLVSQMNAEMYVPIKTIANFKAVKSITLNFDAIVDAISHSPSLNLDSTKSMVRPVLKASRNTLLVRDLKITVEELSQLFEKLGKKPTEIKSDIGDSWYVTFGSDEDALKAFEASHGQNYKDQPIRARIKTENTFRTFHPVTPEGIIPYSTPFPYQHPVTPIVSSQGQENYRGRQWDNGVEPNFTRNRKNYKKKEFSKGSRNSKGGTQNVKETRKRRSSGGANFQLENPGQFPPLPSSGYPQDFKKYSPQEIISVLKSMKDFPPVNVSDCKIILSEPNLEVAVKEFPFKPKSDHPEKKIQSPIKDQVPQKGVWTNRFTKK